MSTSIHLRDVSKAFTVHARSDATILSRMADLIPSENKRHSVRKIQALEHVSLSVQRGEVLGIIGRNASGKSTLLRIIAGIHMPDSGLREVHGMVTPIINMNVGLKHRLTVKDNIFLACSLYGMKHSSIQKTLSSIVEFAGIEEYLDMYPYQLSTGMSQRLSFSIAIHTDPEILLLDEVFSAGDLAFRKRAEERMTELIRSDTTVVMVSHSMPNISAVCDNVLWLEEGKVKDYGATEDVVHSYCADSQKEILPHSKGHIVV